MRNFLLLWPKLKIMMAPKPKLQKKLQYHHCVIEKGAIYYMKLANNSFRFSMYVMVSPAFNDVEQLFLLPTLRNLLIFYIV